jgi:hypothetical protein
MRYVSVVLAAVAVVALSAGSASAVPITLDFEGIGDLHHIGSFYNGGAGGNLGVEFSSSAESLVSASAGGVGNFSNTPSGSSIAFFDWGSDSMSMNVAGGFLNSFSFLYTSLYFPSLVSIWDGADGTGQLLAIAALPRLSGDCGGGAPGAFNCWSSVALDFAGTAKSVKWSGVGNFLGVDNVKFNAAAGDPSNPNPVPEPATLVLLGTGIGVAALRRRIAKRS